MANNDDPPNSDVIESSSSSSTAGDQDAAAPDESEPEPSPTESTPAESDRENLVVTEQGFGSYTAGFDDTLRASWGLVLDNPNAEYWIATSVNVNVSFHDAAGTVLASASDSITAVLPGQTAALAGSVELPEEPAEMRVQARARDWEQADGPGPYGGFTTSGVNVRADEFGGYTVTGAVDSSFDQDFEDVYAVALLRSDAGEIVGGDWTFLDFVPAGGSTSVELNIFDDPPGVTAADLYVMLSNLSLMSADG